MHHLSSRWIDLSQYKTKEILLSVVGSRVASLRPANKSERVYECLCLFHPEKTPSMRLFLNKSYNGWGYKCFGCGKSGDVFTFLMKYERYEFWDAMVYVIKRKHPAFIYNPDIAAAALLKASRVKMSETSSSLFQLAFPLDQTTDDPDLPF